MKEKQNYMIHCPKLKEYIGVDMLQVCLPCGELEVPTNPPVKFTADCAPMPFNQPHLLVSAMEGLRKKNAELTPLQGDELCRVSNRYLAHFEVLERLGIYADLSIRYGKCSLKFEAAQLLLDTEERNFQEYHQEVLMNRISNILDKITNALLKDNSFRKKNKKVTYPLPKINPRSTTITSTGQLEEMKTHYRTN